MLHTRICLVGLIALLGAAPARAQEVKYLPDGCAMFLSIDMAAFLKSEGYAELKKLDKDFERDLGQIGDEFGVPVTNVARMARTAGGGGRDAVIILTTIKPVTPVDIKARRKPYDYQIDFQFKEIKAGSHTIFQETYRPGKGRDGKPAPVVIDGKAFCVLGGKTVLRGEAALLRKILERTEDAKPGAGIAAGLKQTGLTNLLTFVVDFEAMDDETRNFARRDVARLIQGPADAFDAANRLTVRLNATDTATGVITVTCKDADGAAKIKKVAEAGVVALKAMVKDDPNASPRQQQAMRAARTLLDAVKLSTQGATVRAEATISPATGAAVMTGMFGTKASKKFKDVQIPEKK